MQKEAKHYHFDWSIIPDAGTKFENLVACHLLKWVHWRQDAYGDDLALHYYRDRDGREVNFVVTNGREPSLLVECKLSDADSARGLKYLHAKFPDAKAWQIAAMDRNGPQTLQDTNRHPHGTRTRPFIRIGMRLA